MGTSLEGHREEFADVVERWLLKKAARNPCLRYYREWQRDPTGFRGVVVAQGGILIALFIVTVGITLMPSYRVPGIQLTRVIFTLAMILLAGRLFLVSLTLVGIVEGFKRSQEVISPEDDRVIIQSLALLKASDRILPVASPDRQKAIKLTRTLRAFRVASRANRPTLWVLFRTVQQVEEVTRVRARNRR